MPNYRKNKTNKTNRNKNKNKNQNPNQNPNQKDKSNTESSSVRQELNKSESVGIVPILPADVINSCIGSTSFASEINKDISDLLVGDSSPSSNEEIVQIATHIDINTSNSDANTVLIQTNYSSSFSSSTFKKSTEIEEKSGRTVFEGDSALGNSSIIDSFVEDSGIISSKTGSANTKDAAVPTASKSAKKSKETANFSDENRSDSQNVQHGSSGVTVKRTFKKESSKSSSKTSTTEAADALTPIQNPQQHFSKVIAHEIASENTSKSLENISIKDIPPIKQENVPKSTSHTEEPNVIVHQISKDDSLPSTVDNLRQIKVDPFLPETVTIHQKEESKTTSHRASKSNQKPNTVITQQLTKKKAVRTNTTSLQKFKEVQKQTEILDTSAQESHPSSKVIVQQISLEDGQSATITTQAQEQTTSRSEKKNHQSEVISHHISTEESQFQQPFVPPASGELVDQSGKVIIHQVLSEDSAPQQPHLPTTHKITTEDHTVHQHFVPPTQRKTTDQLEKKVILHQTSTEKSTRNQPQHQKNMANQPPKEIIHQISTEQTAPHQPSVPKASTDQSAKVIYHQIISGEPTPYQSFAALAATSAISDQSGKVILNPNYQHPKQQSKSQSTTFEEQQRILQGKHSNESSEMIVNPFLKEFSTQTSFSPLLTPPANLVFRQNTKEKSPELTRSSSPREKESPSRVIIHPILQEKSTQTLSSQSKSEEIPFSKPAKDLEPLKVPPLKSAFPVCRSPKMIVHPIHREGSERPAFPLTTKSIKKLDQSSKHIANQILQDVSSELQSSFRAERETRAKEEVVTEPLMRAFPLSSKRNGFCEVDSDEKVIVHQILREKSTFDQSSTNEIDASLQSPHHKANGLNSITASPSEEPKVIVHQISREDLKSTSGEQSATKTVEPKVIVHQISRDESQPLHTDVSLRSSPINSDPTPRSLASPLRDMVHQISQEESNTTQSKSSTSSYRSPSRIENLEPKVIVHQILKEEETKNQSTQFVSLSKSPPEPKILSQSTTEQQTTSTPITSTKTIDHQTSEESTSSSSSSQGTILTVISTKSPKLDSSPAADEKSPKSLFTLNHADITNRLKGDKSDSSDAETLCGGSETHSEAEEEMRTGDSNDILDEISTTPTPEDSSPKVITHPIVREKTPPESSKVIVQPIVREIFTDKSLSYRVESPQPDIKRTIVKKSKSFDDDDVVIQELSDTSSAGDTDNPPLVSEAESETDTLEAVDDVSDTQIDSRILSIQTLPIDNEENDSSQVSSKNNQDYKVRRQQNRVALQSHFLPQFLAPIFLDSIKEENSDQSDCERRSECSDRTDHATNQGDLEDDVFLEGGPHAKKADAVFPKSNLDFSKKHKHIHTNVRPPKTSIIREEAPPPCVVEAKIIDQGSIEERVSSWSTDLTPESEAAEVVYIDSASSSVSDLLELDYSQGQPEDSNDVRIQTPTIDLESVNEMFSSYPSESNESINTSLPIQSTQPPPVKEDEIISEYSTLPPLTSIGTTTTLPSDTTTTPTAVKPTIPDEIILEKIETMSETVADTANNNNEVAAAADHAQNSKANNPNSCDSAINEVVTSDKSSSATIGYRIEKMENIREIVSASVKSELETITDTDRNVSKPLFKIGEPCSDYVFKYDTKTSSSSLTSSSSTTTTTPTITANKTSETQILTLHDLSKKLDDTKHLHPLGSSSSALDRQESLDSHCSDQSHSTTQSQCTAINQGSIPHCDWNEVDTTTDTTYVSESDTVGLASSENSSPLTTGGARANVDTESPPIRKLRSLCTEALASMPFGEEVLEELATVAHNIGDMPYPLPELPHIQDIQLSLRSEQKPSVINLTQVPPSSTPVGQKFKSPPPPPIPAPPAKYNDSWLGVPTQSDPNVLVCLSPSQRGAVKDNATPDSLLDMHKKFVERRGYHEYSKKEVSEMNKESSYETVTLSKSGSPPPPPPPPRPQPPAAPSPAPPKESRASRDETLRETNINDDDQNNHRLLAIIRGSHQTQQQKYEHHHEQKSSTTSLSENISRRTESAPNTINTTTTTHTINTTNAKSGGGQEEFANSPSVSKQTQERYVSESNKSQSAHYKMQTGQTERMINIENEPIMGLRFPSSDYFDSIFHEPNKRFSNIETGPSAGFCSQILNTQPKRYSNIETSSVESRKCIENGKVLYDVTDSVREKISEGSNQVASEGSVPTSFPKLKTKASAPSVFPHTAATVHSDVKLPKETGDSENIMSAFNLNTKSTVPPKPVHRAEASSPAPPVPPLPSALIDTTATTTSTKSTSTSESVINRNFNCETKEKIFDDFRQHAKEAAAGDQQRSTNENSTSTPKNSDVFVHEKLLKDFDKLSNLLKDELESGKRRPPATLDGSEIPTEVSDYNRVARESKIQTSSHTSSTTTVEQSRREQMKKLADEIDSTAIQRQQQRKEKRIPIYIEKPTPTPPKNAPQAPRSAPATPQSPKTYEIPVHVEKSSETPQQSRSDHQTLKHQRSYEIPIRVEHQTGTRQRTYSEHQPTQRSHEEMTRDQPERYRRAESMFNISESSSHHRMLHDDWMKYVGDLGSSENICKPFQREVEICYMGRRPNIRAPRLSASTSDLSSNSYDTYGAYDVKRSSTNKSAHPQQPQQRRYLSTQSMIDTSPITSCVSNNKSPIMKRRSSLPQEIHDQQLNYITSKEHQLKLEFERLENERRALIDEMNRAQINQRLNREAFRQRQLPPLTEDESFRQQMAQEWLNKVAEREERRLQKIIKISKVNQEANLPAAPPRGSSSLDIGDEFLSRVKERRSKLHMPSDSDWESGAESQPVPRNDGSRSENENEDPPMTVLEGQSAADIKRLPKHLREFAKLSSQVKEEHREETTENTSCSAHKKSTITTTIKTSNAGNFNNNSSAYESTRSYQQDADRVRDLEQLSQGKRQKLVTILRHKKPAESSSSCQLVDASAGATLATGTSNTGTGGGGANSVKRRKQTRFLLTPNRRSWSESDLLREIDKELVLAKGFLYANGVWIPKNQTPSSSRTNLNDDFRQQNTTGTKNNNNNTPTTAVSPNKFSENRSEPTNCKKGIPIPPPPPLWTPQPERKQFRAIHFESPTLQRKYVVRQQSTPSEAAPPPWSYTNSQPFPGYQSRSCTNLSQRGVAIPWPPAPTASSATSAPQNGGAIVTEPDDDDIDNNNNGDFAPTTSIAEKIRNFERSNSNTDLRRPFVRHNPHEKPAILRPNEVIYSVKNEYMSEPETEYEKPKRMAQLSRRQYDGIGPTTRDGMPVVLRSEVKEPNQHEWYKRIFQTIHKQKNPDDYVTIRYKCPRGRYPYKSNGYMSEPEPNYDSDYSTVKYRTLERRRLQSTGTGTGTDSSIRTHTGQPIVTGPSTSSVGNDSQADTFYGTMPNPVKSGQGSYKVQPGRIENYVTGHSSVSEKEKKEWWDEVMDIFNGWLIDNNNTLPRIFIEFANEVQQFQLDQQKLSPHYTEGNLSRALLKEQGYTSDSNIVFRKKDIYQQSPLSPVEQKQVYKSVQAGGQPPLLGFRKPAPEKPKDSEDVPSPPVPPVPPTKGVPLDSNGFNNLESPNRYFESDVNIHYKTPIRYEYKDPIPEEELVIRQAESMQRLYQEERRRKYLQELQDMNARRHTDNFTPSQKSPIPLNRYDDFNSDLAPKSPNSSSYPKTIARALYNFQGQTARELTFKKGDVIYIRRQIDKNWYEGEHNAMIGLLPSNYVELITKDGIRQPPKKPSEGQARAKYNFQAQSGIELSLNKGEHVTLTRRVDDNWFEGKIANRKGIFPVSYVEVLVDIGAEDKARTPASQTIITTQTSSMRPSLDTLRTNINNEFNTLTSNGQHPNGILRETKTQHKTEVLHVDTNTEPVAYRSLYKYRPQNTDELELQEGDIVYVLEKCDDGWFVGTSQRTGCFGTFPGNYVERV